MSTEILHQVSKEIQASNSNAEVELGNQAQLKIDEGNKPLKEASKKSPIRELAKSAADHNASIVPDASQKFSPGYEEDFQDEDDDDEEEDEDDDQEGNEDDDDEDDPKEDPKAPEHEIKNQKLGSKILQTELSKGLKHGLTSVKTKEGHYEMQAHYIKDKLEGITTYYYPDGKTEREIHFKEGKMHGLMKAFHENGSPSMEVEYENGVMHGTTTIYDDFGQKQVISNYKEGKLHGDTIVFSNGKPYLKKTYKEGKEIHQEYDASAAHSC